MRSFYFNRTAESARLASDLASERRRADTTIPGIDFRIAECDVGKWECLRVTDEEGARSIDRPAGNYDTLSTARMDMLTDEEIYDVQDEVARKLCEMFDKNSITPDKILVVGLGNRMLTPDSVGSKAAERVQATMHIREFDEEMFGGLGCSEIAVITPGVSAQSGLDATEMVKGICRRIIPDAVIAIDAYAARSQKRLGTTIQISDTGLCPGSGVGNHRQSLSEATLSTPVIAIGVPTVIDSRVFAMGEDFDGALAGEAMLVSPKEIDEITTVAAKIIGGAINQAFGISPY